MVNKKNMACNKVKSSYKRVKKMVKACEGGKENIHFGAKGYGHNYSAAAKKAFEQDTSVEQQNQN